MSIPRTSPVVAKRIRGICCASRTAPTAKSSTARLPMSVMARVIDQGSRLSAVRLAMAHAACDVLGLGTFDEDALYENLDWLAGIQASVEDKLFAQRIKTKPVSLFLYDVTSSYVEGTQNALAAFGANRDGKKGKRQIVLGLL